MLAAEYQSGQGYESCSFGEMSPKVVLLDNKFETVEPYKDYLWGKGISTLMTSRVGPVRTAYSRYENRAAYIFDMHMRNIQQVGTRSTEGGLSVGVAMIADLTNDGAENQIAHCATLTEYPTEEAAKTSYTYLEKKGQHVTRLRKNERFEDFECFIEDYERQFLSEYKTQLVVDYFDSLERAYKTVSDDDEWMEAFAAMFGFPASRQRVFWEKREAITELVSTDLEERIQALTYIRKGVFQQFDDDPVAEMNWFRETRLELNGRSAWECLTSGSIDDVALVAHFVNRTIG